MNNNYTLLTDAFNFSTTMPHQSSIKNSHFSLECIYCKCENSRELVSDGSFRQCMNQTCKRHFQAKIKPSQHLLQQPSANQNQNHNQKQRHPNDYIMFQQRQFMQEPIENNNPMNTPTAIESNLQQQFSQPNYDPQIRYK